MCGRFLSGLVASDSDVGPILLHIGAYKILKVYKVIISCFVVRFLVRCEKCGKTHLLCKECIVAQDCFRTLFLSKSQLLVSVCVFKLQT